MRKNHFAAKCPAKTKVSTIQEWFYLSTAGVIGHESREMVTLAVSKDGKFVIDHEVAFLMDAGAECNLLPLDVYKEVTGDLDVNFLDTRAKSVQILANGYEEPIEGKATLFVTRKGNTHKIQVNVVKGRGYEPILSKETMLVMNLIKILDCDRDLCINVLKVGMDPLLEEHNDVFEGIGKLDGKYSIVTDKSVKPVVHPPQRLPVAMTEKA